MTIEVKPHHLTDAAKILGVECVDELALKIKMMMSSCAGDLEQGRAQGMSPVDAFKKEFGVAEFIVSEVISNINRRFEIPSTGAWVVQEEDSAIALTAGEGLDSRYVRVQYGPALDLVDVERMELKPLTKTRAAQLGRSGLGDEGKFADDDGVYR